MRIEGLKLRMRMTVRMTVMMRKEVWIELEVLLRQD